MHLSIEVELKPELKSKLIHFGFASISTIVVGIVQVGNRYEVGIDQATHGLSFNKKAVDKFTLVTSMAEGFQNTGYCGKPLPRAGDPASFMRQKFKTLEKARFVFDECSMWVKDSDYYRLVDGLE